MIRRVPREPDAEAAAFVAWVRTRPCRVWCAARRCVAGLDPSGKLGTPCLGVIHAHHAGERGLGQKASDWTCTPLCARHYGELHDCRGTFANWSKAQRRDWQDTQIALTLAGWHEVRDQDPDRDLPF